MFGPLIVKPSPGKEAKGDKTGSWRMKLRPQFLQKNCIACKMCALMCPEGCVTGKEKNAYICDYNYCKGCGVCAALCPKADIIMIEEPQEGEKK